MQVGQGLLLSLDFADGGLCNYKRTFLIIEVLEKEVFLLNISSLEGKERKLAFPSNERLYRYRPPFMRKSFFKMDALYIIPNSHIVANYLLADGRCMHPNELSEVVRKYTEYRENNQIGIAQVDLIEFCKKNASNTSNAVGE